MVTIPHSEGPCHCLSPINTLPTFSYQWYRGMLICVLSVITMQILLIFFSTALCYEQFGILGNIRFLFWFVQIQAKMAAVQLGKLLSVMFGVVSTTQQFLDQSLPWNLNKKMVLGSCSVKGLKVVEHFVEVCGSWKCFCCAKVPDERLTNLELCHGKYPYMF